MGHGVTFGSRSKWLETVLLGGTGWVSGGLVGFGALLIFDPSHTKKIFSYIFSIYLGSVGGWWVMVARVEILLFMGLLGCGIIVLRGPAAIGHIKNFGCRSKNFYSIYNIYRLGVGGGFVGDDCARGDIVIYGVFAWC